MRQYLLVIMKNGLEIELRPHFASPKVEQSAVDEVASNAIECALALSSQVDKVRKMPERG